MSALEDRGIVYRFEWSVGVGGLKHLLLTGRKVWSSASDVEFVVRDCGVADGGATSRDHRVERWHSTEREAALATAAELAKFNAVISAAVKQIYDEIGPPEG